MRSSLVAVVLLTFLLTASIAFGAPTEISYQGKLTDAAGQNIDSFFDITFRLYDDSTGGSILWQETQGVTVAGGLFSVQLGSSTPLDMSTMPVQPGSIWLGIQLGSDGELSPRTRLSSVPSAAVASSLRGDVTTSPGSLSVRRLDDDDDGDGILTTDDVDQARVVLSKADAVGNNNSMSLRTYLPGQPQYGSITIKKGTAASSDTLIEISATESSSQLKTYWDGMDDNCNGVVSADSSGASLRAEWWDGMDDNCNGVVSADSSGASLSANWGNGIDDDCDGDVSVDESGARMSLGASSIGGGVLVTTAANLLDQNGHVSVLKISDTGADSTVLARLFGDPDFAALDLTDPQATSEKSRGITINTSHIESKIHLGDNTFGLFDPTAVGNREMYLGVDETSAKFALGQEGIIDDDLSQGIFAEVSDTGTIVILTDPNGAARFAIREGGRTVGAGQVTTIEAGRMSMVDSLADGTVSKILDRGEAGDNVGRTMLRTGRNPQTGATIQMIAETALNDTTGAHISLRRLDPDSDDDGLLDMVVNEDGPSLIMNKVDMVDDEELLEISLTIDSSKAALHLSKADAKRALEAVASSSEVGLLLIDSTLNDSGLLINLKIDESGPNLRMAKDQDNADGTSSRIEFTVLPDRIELARTESGGGSSFSCTLDMEKFVRASVSPTADTTLNFDFTNSSFSFHAPGGPSLTPSQVAIADLNGDGLLDLRVDGSIGVGVASPTNSIQVAQGSLTDPIADAWTTYSSRRWKENIRTITDAVAKVQKLRGVEYDWKSNGKHDIGLIAEEVGQVIPEVVVYEANGVDAQSVDYPRLVALLIEASKAQQTELENMKAELARLNAAIIRLADKNKSTTDSKYGMK